MYHLIADMIIITVVIKVNIAAFVLGLEALGDLEDLEDLGVAEV